MSLYDGICDKCFEPAIISSENKSGVGCPACESIPYPGSSAEIELPGSGHGLNSD
jgi:hypothetical protein